MVRLEKLTIRPIWVNELEELKQIGHLYNIVWNREDIVMTERLMRHSTYPGFKGKVACHDTGEIIGFAYGFTSKRNQYYHQVLREQLNRKEAKIWLKSCFEFAELAVHPNVRKQKIGEKLIRELLQGLPHQTTILTTQVDNLAARKLYEKLGWETIKASFLPLEDGEPFVIMGKHL